MSSTGLAYAEPALARRQPTALETGPASERCDVAVIGAGPYGLAVAAHLKASGIEIRIFGEAMGFWRHNMPGGMRIRSPWRATHIADPANELSLDVYADRVGMKPAEQMPIADFVRYGAWFQNRAVPDLDPRKVVSVAAAGNAFRLVLADGATLEARRVVVAMGLANQSFRPAQFAALPSALASHSSDHADFGCFRGRTVTVIGRGQSAGESAVLLHEAGAEVALVSRGPVHWLGSGAPADGIMRTLRRALGSKSEVGPFPLDWLADAPGLVRLLPDEVRAEVTTRCLRPAVSGWLKPRADGVSFVPGRLVAGTERRGSRIELRFDDGSSRLTDHVLLATGYRIDIGRLGIFGPDLLGRIDTVDGYPRLSAGFRSSVPGLHFVGATAVKSFGPLMRFIAGAGYAARCVTQSALATRS